MNSIVTITYKYGFSYDGKTYCWKDKKLFRMPFSKKLRHYGKKALSQQVNGSTLGYYIGRSFKSMKTIKELTCEINHVEHEVVETDCPF